MLVHEVGKLLVEDDEHRLDGKLALHVPVVSHDVRIDQLVGQIGSIFDVTTLSRKLHDEVLEEDLNVAWRRDPAVGPADLREELFEVGDEGCLVRLYEDSLDGNEGTLH